MKLSLSSSHSVLIKVNPCLRLETSSNIVDIETEIFIILAFNNNYMLLYGKEKVER